MEEVGEGGREGESKGRMDGGRGGGRKGEIGRASCRERV